MITVLEFPQWQGSASPAARRLAEGARITAAVLPASQRIRVAVAPASAAPASAAPATAAPPTAAANGAGAVRRADSLTANLRAARAALDGAADELVVTAGGDCGVELAPVERASQRYGDGLAVVWFDAHGDLNSPATSPSGAFHGMVLRTLLGDGPAALIPGRPLTAGQVVLAGVRAMDPGERDFAQKLQLRHLRVAELTDPDALIAAIAATGAGAVYLHIDLDVLDPPDFGSVGYPEPDGLAPALLTAAIRALAARYTIAGVGITEHQPGGTRPASSAPDAPRDAAVLEHLARAIGSLLPEYAEFACDVRLAGSVHRYVQHADVQQC